MAYRWRLCNTSVCVVSVFHTCMDYHEVFIVYALSVYCVLCVVYDVYGVYMWRVCVVYMGVVYVCVYVYRV